MFTLQYTTVRSSHLPSAKNEEVAYLIAALTYIKKNTADAAAAGTSVCLTLNVFQAQQA